MRSMGIAASFSMGAAVTVCLLVAGPASGVTRYSIVELGSLYQGYGQETIAYGINNAGQVVGGSRYTAVDPFPMRPFLWQNGQMTELETPQWTRWAYDWYGIARSINDSGVVAGGAEFGQNELHAVTWTNGTLTDLGTLAGKVSSAQAINNAGQVVGASTYDPASPPYDNRLHAFLWDQGTLTDLGTLGGESSRAYDINDSGQVVGYANAGTGGTYGTGIPHAFVWQDGAMTDLTPSLPDMSEAWGINAVGSIVGKARLTQSTAWSPIVWRKGSMAPLDLLDGTLEAWATDINDAEQIAGTLYLNAGRGHRAVLWDEGAPYDLNSLVDFPTGSNWVLRYAAEINNSAQIIASDYVGHQFVLTPIPEPSSVLLLSLITASILRRRR